MTPLYKIGDEVEVYRAVGSKGNLPESKRVKGVIVSKYTVHYNRADVWCYVIKHPANWDRDKLIVGYYYEDQLRRDG